jgi:hypothetical protein
VWVARAVTSSCYDAGVADVGAGDPSSCLDFGGVDVEIVLDCDGHRDDDPIVLILNPVVQSPVCSYSVVYLPLFLPADSPQYLFYLLFQQ